MPPTPAAMDTATPVTTETPLLCLPYSSQESDIVKYFASVHSQAFLTSSLTQPACEAAREILEIDGAAAARAIDAIDTKRVYYVNMVPGQADSYRGRLIDLQENVSNFRSWATAWTARVIAKYHSGNYGNIDRVQFGNLKANILSYFFEVGNAALNSYNSSQCLQQTLKVQDPGFHANMVSAAMTGLTVPLADSTIELLDKVLVQIVNDLKRSSVTDTKAARHFFILLTVYKLDKSSGVISCEMRTINFLSTPVSYEVSHGKHTDTHVYVRLEFSVHDYHFNEPGWLQMCKDLEELIKEGRGLMKDDPTLDVPVD